MLLLLLVVVVSVVSGARSKLTTVAHTPGGGMGLVKFRVAAGCMTLALPVLL